MNTTRLQTAYTNAFALTAEDLAFADVRPLPRVRPRTYVKGEGTRTSEIAKQGAGEETHEKEEPMHEETNKATPTEDATQDKGGEHALYFNLAAVEDDASQCERCALAATRTNVVFGKGSTTPAIVFVGEAPGEQEDLQGLPFVGRAGKLLDKWLTLAGLTLDDVYIMNTLKCRPPNNRDPLPEEKAACREWFDNQLRLLAPKVICALGKQGFGNLVTIDPTASFGSYRGKTYEYQGARVIATYHPSYLLRSPQMMPKVYEDLHMLLTIAERPIPPTLTQAMAERH